MSGKAKSTLLQAIAWLVLAIVISNMVLSQRNRALALDNARQQQFVQSTVPLDALNKELIKALVELALKNQDEQLRNLLASNGITYNFNPATGAAVPAAKK